MRESHGLPNVLGFVVDQRESWREEEKTETIHTNKDGKWPVSPLATRVVVRQRPRHHCILGVSACTGDLASELRTQENVVKPPGASRLVASTSPRIAWV